MLVCTAMVSNKETWSNKTYISFTLSATLDPHHQAQSPQLREIHFSKTSYPTRTVSNYLSLQVSITVILTLKARFHSLPQRRSLPSSQAHPSQTVIRGYHTYASQIQTASSAPPVSLKVWIPFISSFSTVFQMTPSSQSQTPSTQYGNVLRPRI